MHVVNFNDADIGVENAPEVVFVFLFVFGLQVQTDPHEMFVVFEIFIVLSEYFIELHK